ncbi:MAG: hypothetical protein DRJ61_00485 [Acidobacteria bacterium]|nr:MAG: hypothetical protein DRJ61_00485 [Acidobacteriota bacterium]
MDEGVKRVEKVEGETQSESPRSTRRHTKKMTLVGLRVLRGHIFSSDLSFRFRWVGHVFIIFFACCLRFNCVFLRSG